MTDAAARPFWSFAAEATTRFWRRLLDLTGKSVIAAGLVLAAGVVAVAAAVTAIIMAAAAVILRLTARSKPSPATGPDFDGVTLEARRTARGWTVE
ncbi:MAG: hypothetical protein AAFX03_09265 [Pseudomonadota bacterium]